MWVEPRENGCSRTPRRLRKLPGEEARKSWDESLDFRGDIPPLTVSL